MSKAKFYLLLFLGLFSFLIHAVSPLDFVIDLDGVLLYALQPGQDVNLSGGKIIDMQDGSKYRLSDGSIEFLESLTQIQGARISFFSTGIERRNLEVLKKIVLSNGKTAYDLCEGRVFSRENIVLKSQTDTKTKDLRLVADRVDLNRAILIDDHEKKAAKHQEGNLLWVPVASDVYKNLLPVHTIALEEGDIRQADFVEIFFILERNKLVIVRGIIDRVIELSDRDKISPVDALRMLQRRKDKNGVKKYNQELLGIETLRRGLKAFKMVNPEFHMTHLIPDSCIPVLTRLSSLRKNTAN